MWLNIVFYKPHGCSCMKEHVFHSTTELWACVFSATTSHRGNVILGWRYRGRTGEDSRLLWECVAADVYRCCWLSGGWRWGWWSSSPLAWQWTDRQRCGLYHIWRTPHGLTDTQTQGQDPRCSNTHTHTHTHTLTHTHTHTRTHTHKPQVFTMMVNMTICFKTRSKIQQSMFWCFKDALNNPELHRGYSLLISSWHSWQQIKTQ